MSNEVKKIHISNRIKLLEGRGEFNRRIINKLERQFRKLS